jgi:hypothetical protein
MVLATRPRQDDIRHHLPDSADVSVVRGDRLLRLRTICATREEAERTFLLFTFTYGLGAGRPLRVGQAPGGAVWEAPVTAVGREARVCMSCDRYVPIFDCCVDANNICMACMLAGRGPARPPVPFATPRQPETLAPAPHSGPAATAIHTEPARPARRRRGGRRRHGAGSSAASAPLAAGA